MSPASARALRRRRVADLRVAEPDLSLRQMAERLGVSRDTVSRDLADIGRRAADSATAAETGTAGPVEHSAPVAHGAPQVSDGGRAADATAAGLPRRVAQPLAGVDLARWPAARRDLAVLAQTGRTAEAMAHQAITALAHHYARALAAGDIEPGQEFIVTAMEQRPLPRPAARTAEPAPA